MSVKIGLVKKHLIKEMTFEQKFEGGEVSHIDIWKKRIPGRR